jgi:putative photosynthetic complex assembly protein
VLIGAAILISFTIAVAAFVRLTGIGKDENEFAPAVVERQLYFHEIDPNTIEVIADGGRIATLDANDDGFIFGVLRGLGHNRKVNEADMGQPYVVSQRADGRILLEDPMTGDQLDLRAYGVDNAAAFAELLRAEQQGAPTAAASPADGLPGQPRAAH